MNKYIKEITLQDKKGRFCNLEKFILEWWTTSEEDVMYSCHTTNSIHSSLEREELIAKNIYFLENIAPILEATGRVNLAFRGSSDNIQVILKEQKERLKTQKENTKELKKRTFTIEVTK